MKFSYHRYKDILNDFPFIFLLGEAVLVLFATSSFSYDADFWWSDASRHAMDGVFLHDFLSVLPFNHAREYLINYYIKYPALTIMYYPPLFAFVEGILFLLFGISHLVAQATVSFFYFVVALGTFFFSKRYLSSWQAFAVSLLFIGNQEVAFWGRQVMLDVPCYAFFILSIYFLFCYLDTYKRQFLYLLLIAVIAGLYTKQSMIFMILIFGWVFWSKRRDPFSKDPYFWGAVLLFILAVIPFAFISIKSGAYNFYQVMGTSRRQFPYYSLRTFLFYLNPWKIIKKDFIIIPLLASIFLIVSFLRKNLQLPKFHHKFFLVWLIGGYIFFSLVSAKCGRYTIYFLFPVILFSALLLNRVFSQRIASFLIVTIAIVNFTCVILCDPVPYTRGYSQAIDFIAEHAPSKSSILISCMGSGPLIFDLRKNEKRRDLGILRADKLFFKGGVQSQFAEEYNLDKSKITEMINRYGVSYIVVEPHFEINFRTMQQLQDVLQYPQFREVARFPITSNFTYPDKELIVYQNKMSVARTLSKIKIYLPKVGTAIEGEIN